MKKIFLFISIISFLNACSNKVNKKNIQGVWWSTHDNKSNTTYSEIIINQDSIILVDGFITPYFGTFSLESNNLNIKLKQGNLIKKISFNKKDSILTFNNTKYWKYSNSAAEKYYDFNLINISSNNKSNIESLNENTFKILKDYKGNFKISYNNQFVKKEDILRFFGVHDYSNECNIIIGDKVNLENLKSIYYYLAYRNINKVNLLTKRDFDSNYYYYYTDLITIWRNDIAKKLNLGYTSSQGDRINYLIDNNAEHILLNNKKDISKLSLLKKYSKVLVSVNQNLPLKFYLNVLDKCDSIKKIYNINIKVEIFTSPPN